MFCKLHFYVFLSYHFNSFDPWLGLKAVPDAISLPLSTALKPKEVVEQLNKFIVGQPDAKRAVAIALRNRWRRFRLTPDLKNEVLLLNDCVFCVC